MFIWGDFSGARWHLLEERLWIYSERNDRMLMPAGDPVSPAQLLQVSDGLREAGKSGDFALVDNELVAAHPELTDHFSVEVDFDNADYVYLTQKLVGLKGRKLSKKKNLLAQFLAAAGGYQALRLDPRDADGCYALAEKWCQVKNCERLGFTHETSALRKALTHFSTLKLEGIKILLENEMAAFPILSPLNRDTADIHFEKFNPEIKGSGQAINWETARILAPRFKYLNREQDLGIGWAAPGRTLLRIPNGLHDLAASPWDIVGIQSNPVCYPIDARYPPGLEDFLFADQFFDQTVGAGGLVGSVAVFPNRQDSVFGIWIRKKTEKKAAQFFPIGSRVDRHECSGLAHRFAFETRLKRRRGSVQADSLIPCRINARRSALRAMRRTIRKSPAGPGSKSSRPVVSALAAAKSRTRSNRQPGSRPTSVSPSPKSCSGNSTRTGSTSRNFRKSVNRERGTRSATVRKYRSQELAMAWTRSWFR